MGKMSFMTTAGVELSNFSTIQLRRELGHGPDGLFLNFTMINLLEGDTVADTELGVIQDISVSLCC